MDDTATIDDTSHDDTRRDDTELGLERRDLLQALAAHRGFLRRTTRDLSDKHGAFRSTVSELTVGGLIKHVTSVESNWYRFIVEGTQALSTDAGDFDAEQYMAGFVMGPDDTLASLLEQYDEVAARTDELVRTHPDLDEAHPLPSAPWFEPGATWSARRVLLHIVAETAQHAGHADIIRESIDGARTMG